MSDRTSWPQRFAVFARPGLTSFGGPAAHLGHFREAFVGRRQGFTDADDADLLARTQFLPGPASSKAGFAIGPRRARAAAGRPPCGRGRKLIWIMARRAECGNDGLRTGSEEQTPNRVQNQARPLSRDT